MCIYLRVHVGKMLVPVRALSALGRGRSRVCPDHVQTFVCVGLRSVFDAVWPILCIYCGVRQRFDVMKYYVSTKIRHGWSSCIDIAKHGGYHL